MHPIRDLPTVTQNGYSNHILASPQSDSSLGAQCGKYAYRNGMAVTTDGYASQNMYHNQSHHHQALNGYLHHNQQPSPFEQNSVSHDTFGHKLFDVWDRNFQEGMQLLRNLSKDCRYVAVDTEFPGVVAKVFGEYPNSFEQAYHNIKVNIDMLKPIQIGFSFFTEKGQPNNCILQDTSYSTVQFNIKWNVDNDTYADDSIKLLAYSGIDFEKLKRTGIELSDFAEAFIASGLPINDRITWIGFHSAYDFAYMMKICTDWRQMPDNFQEFQNLLLIYFPRIVDLKAMMNEHKFPKSGLQELADSLRVPRIGFKHQAGSDAMLTGETFFRFIEEHGAGKIEQGVLNLVYGLNYCPNGVSNTWMRMNTSSPFLDNVPSNRDITSAFYRNTVHSADHSGRSSPADSNSGHKSS